MIKTNLCTKSASIFLHIYLFYLSTIFSLLLSSNFISSVTYSFLHHTFISTVTPTSQFMPFFFLNQFTQHLDRVEVGKQDRKRKRRRLRKKVLDREQTRDRASEIEMMGSQYFQCLIESHSG